LKSKFKRSGGISVSSSGLLSISRTFIIDMRTRKRASANLLLADESARLHNENFDLFIVCLKVNDSLFCFNDKKAEVGDGETESTEESTEFDFEATAVFNILAEVDGMGVEFERFATKWLFFTSDLSLSAAVVLLVRAAAV
jgi:hypothetical protein